MARKRKSNEGGTGRQCPVSEVGRGDVRGLLFPGFDLNVLLDEKVILLDGRCVDAKVVIDKGKHAVTTRLVMIPGPSDRKIILRRVR